MKMHGIKEKMSYSLSLSLNTYAGIYTPVVYTSLLSGPREEWRGWLPGNEL